MEVYVFRTGAAKEEDVKKVAPLLNSIKGVHRWTIDLEDPENILRVEKKIEKKIDEKKQNERIKKD